MTKDLRRYAAATKRNRKHILKVLKSALPNKGKIIEVASGTGEHACYFAAAFPSLSWQPTDIDQMALESIEAHRLVNGKPNLLPPLHLDVNLENWPINGADGAICINMLHITPWHCCEGLIKGCSNLLQLEKPLILYGPFKQHGQHTSESNFAFDQYLRQQNSTWGIRNLDDITKLASAHKFTVGKTIPMPANNFCLVLLRSS